MKKVLSLIMAMMLMITMVGCKTTNNDTADTKFTAGTYTAEAQGFHGPVKVEVEVDAETILSVTVVEQDETQGVGTNAIDALPGLIVKHQSLAVDGVSGATVTSEALISAVEAALVEAGATAEELYTEVKDEAATVEDAEAHVLREDGSVIKGLYAGGETTCSKGQGLTRAVTIGRMAGETAAKEIAE